MLINGSESILSNITLLSLLVFVLVFGVLLLASCTSCFNSNDDHLPAFDVTDNLQRDIVYQRQSRAINERNEIVMEAQCFLRSRPYVLNKNLLRIGSRENKYYFRIKNSRGKSLMMALAKQDPGSIVDISSQKHKQVMVDILYALDHPFVFPLVDADYNIDNSTFITVRNFIKTGSLKDNIYRTKPEIHHDAKYSKMGRPFSQRKIFLYGRQILEAMNYLIQSGYHGLDIQCSNIYVVDGICMISDIENSFLGLPRFHDRIIKQFCKKNPKNIKRTDFNILCFGAVIYELATGEQMNNISQATTFPLEASPPIKELLDLIFLTGEETKGPVITIEELLEDSIFSTVSLSKKYRDYSPEPITFEGKELALLNSVRNNIRQNIIKSLPRRKRKKKEPEEPLVELDEEPTKAPPPPAQNATGPPPPPNRPPPAASTGRGNLLSSISGFSKGGLNSVETNDRSAPKL
eukprot:TRINITY_DN6755_c0_g1_i1.p1 TRINITY_DN6755_c0_g1~~TRINITY_DN6755_c0_g1_i1.p1  ORF type:complete len:463 (-),score=113.99 TRINITY_DN6755_c0_g1_i1:50-1438(-)